MASTTRKSISVEAAIAFTENATTVRALFDDQWSFGIALFKAYNLTYRNTPNVIGPEIHLLVKGPADRVNMWQQYPLKAMVKGD